MAEADTPKELRQRAQATKGVPPPSSSGLKKQDDPTDSAKGVPLSVIKKEDSAPFSLIELLRTVAFIILASSALSYFVTRESFVWGMKRPSWTKPEQIKAWMAGPIQYTDADLAAFDGTDPSKPILLAINGTIYDVSAGRRFYGPGGSYSFFSGCDASRAFITSCFEEDRIPDIRGAELMYIPRDNPEIDNLYTKGELKNLKELERRKAKKDVYKALKHWVDFFEKSPKYTKVGIVKREKGWETKGPVPTLCKKAEEGRPSSRPKPPGRD
ncbi:putative membrane steroid-binding protein 2 [Halenospora varia]|nr:putative membrane steroid-binding protein 2 [Halenospora varia]